MRSIKTHFGVIFSLIGLIFSIQFCILTNDIMRGYEILLSKNYKIIISSKFELTDSDFMGNLKGFKNIQNINLNKFLQNLDGKVSQNTIKSLGEKLPKFYSLQLNFFPNSSELNEIYEQINKNTKIDKIEVFTKTHDSIYQILVSLKFIIYIFAFIVVILGGMLILKQMRIWIFEHKERIDIMTLFGASFLYKSSKLYKMAIIDSLFSSLCVAILFYLLPEFSVTKEILNAINLQFVGTNFFEIFIRLFGISLAISIFAVTSVMIKVGFENR